MRITRPPVAIKGAGQLARRYRLRRADARENMDEDKFCDTLIAIMRGIRFAFRTLAHMDCVMGCVTCRQRASPFRRNSGIA
jgi:hypothetical protein